MGLDGFVLLGGLTCVIAVQPFWGEACRRAGVGPKPIPIDSLNKSKLIQALKYMAKPEVPNHPPSHIVSVVICFITICSVDCSCETHGSEMFIPLRIH